MACCVTLSLCSKRRNQPKKRDHDDLPRGVSQAAIVLHRETQGSNRGLNGRELVQRRYT